MKDVEFTFTANKQLHEWQECDKKIYNQIKELVFAIQQQPFKGIGKPEPLKYQLKGLWSRRITKEHRLIYKVTDKSIVVISCKYHY